MDAPMLVQRIWEVAIWNQEKAQKFKWYEPVIREELEFLFNYFPFKAQNDT